MILTATVHITFQLDIHVCRLNSLRHPTFIFHIKQHLKITSSGHSLTQHLVLVIMIIDNTLLLMPQLLTGLRFIHPNPRTRRPTKEQFILAKYRDNRFCQRYDEHNTTSLNSVSVCRCYLGVCLFGLIPKHSHGRARCTGHKK